MIAMRIPGWFGCYLLVVLLWGGSYGLTEVALTAFSPGQVALWRALLGAGSLLVLVLITGQRLPRLGAAGAVRLLLLAALTTAASVSAATAQQRMPSGMVAVLCATTPLFAVFLHRFTRGHTPAATWAGALLGFGGVAVLFSPSGHIDGVAVALSLGSAACLALAGFFAGIFFAATDFSGTQLTMTQLLFSGLLLAPVTPGDSTAAVTGIGPLLALAILGVLGAAVANVLFWRVLREAGPVVVSTTYQTVPLVAVVVGIVALGEHLGTGEVIGAALILAGLSALLLGNSRVLKQEDTGFVNRKGRFADRQPVMVAASLITSPETPPAQRKSKAEIMNTVTRIAAGLLIAAGLTIGTAPLAAAEAGKPDSSTSQADTQTARPAERPTGLNGNLPQRTAPDTGFDQFGHLPFNPATPGGD